MEEITTPEPQQVEKLYLKDIDRNFLETVAKWANYFAILAFILAGLSALVGLLGIIFSGLAGGAFLPGLRNDGSSVTLFATLLIISPLYAIPGFYLFRFASRIRSAFALNSQGDLTDSLEYLKKNFTFCGILSIIVIFFYILAFVFALSGIYR